MTPEELDVLKATDPDQYLLLTDGQAWAELHDTRPRVTVHKPIVLDQLDRELGGHGLSGSATDLLHSDAAAADVVVVEGSPVTQQELEAAVVAHVAVFPPTSDEQVAAIVDAAPDWQTAMKDMAAGGLLG